jgi:thiosulfate dehydrogenase
MGRILFGIVLGLVLFPAAILMWVRYGQPPAAVADKPFFYEEWIAKTALHGRIDREAPKLSPIPVNEENLAGGARIYRDRCMVCHGVHGQASPTGSSMYPKAPPLWEQHRSEDVVGVSDDPVGETYWKVANGIRLTGMPAYQGVLTNTEIWQVSLLLANANKPLPPAALSLLKEQPAQASAEPSAKAGGATKE